MIITKVDRLRALDDLRHAQLLLFDRVPDMDDWEEAQRLVRRALAILHEAERQDDRQAVRAS